jgi:hypothetical protein
MCVAAQSERAKPATAASGEKEREGMNESDCGVKVNKQYVHTHRSMLMYCLISSVPEYSSE